jgi:Mycothiol maleylpyruvate isomerase N-terminal domain
MPGIRESHRAGPTVEWPCAVLTQPLTPLDTAHLFRPLLEESLLLLRGLSPDDWQRQTVAPKWRVRDVAAHLLDVKLRKVAVYRDHHFPPVDKPPVTDAEVAQLVNGLNAAGIQFAARLSPRLIVDLLAIAGGWVAEVIEGLPPHDRSIFSVSWAGESESENWMDTGREYTEWWHHQMQIRDAVGAPKVLLQPTWMLPLLDMSVRALPYTYRSVDAKTGASVTLKVTGETTGSWTLVRDASSWRIGAGTIEHPAATVEIAADDAWRLLYNAPVNRSRIRVTGDAALAEPLIGARSVVL